MPDVAPAEPVHIGRSWVDHPLEDDCPCPQEPCGLIDLARVDPACTQHPMGRAKTIRQMHRAENCPGAPVDPAAQFLAMCPTCQTSQSQPQPHVECYRVDNGSAHCCCWLQLPTPGLGAASGATPEAMTESPTGSGYLGPSMQRILASLKDATELRLFSALVQDGHPKCPVDDTPITGLQYHDTTYAEFVEGQFVAKTMRRLVLWPCGHEARREDV